MCCGIQMSESVEVPRLAKRVKAVDVLTRAAITVFVVGMLAFMAVHWPEAPWSPDIDCGSRVATR